MQTIVLQTSDQKTSLGTAEIAAYPDNPQIIVWQGRAFSVTFTFGSGPAVYSEITAQFLSDKEVTRST